MTMQRTDGAFVFNSEIISGKVYPGSSLGKQNFICRFSTHLVVDGSAFHQELSYGYFHTGMSMESL